MAWTLQTPCGPSTKRPNAPTELIITPALATAAVLSFLSCLARTYGCEVFHIGHILSDGYISNLNQIGIDLGQLTYYDRGAPTVAIQGPTQVPGMGIQCSWQSQVISGGIPPYTYSWSGLLSGSGGAVSGPIYSSGTLYLTVTDFWGRQGSSSLGVTVVQMPPSCE